MIALWRSRSTPLGRNLPWNFLSTLSRRSTGGRGGASVSTESVFFAIESNLTFLNERTRRGSIARLEPAGCDGRTRFLGAWPGRTAHETGQCNRRPDPLTSYPSRRLVGRRPSDEGRGPPLLACPGLLCGG